jgi:rhodanese-related sulfurtransferase
MISFFKKVFDGGQKADFGELIANGAIIIDVRTTNEYQNGHLKNSINIPLDRLEKSLTELDRLKPVITCCASGTRSLIAKNILKSNGFTEVCNGGSWTSLRKFEN